MYSDENKIENVAAYSLEKYIKECKGNCILVDVRSREKFIQGNIKGAINIYYKDILEGKSDLSKKKKIILYCDRGGLSMVVARYLSSQGYSVTNVVGGLNNYYRIKRKK